MEEAYKIFDWILGVILVCVLTAVVYGVLYTLNHDVVTTSPDAAISASAPNK